MWAGVGVLLGLVFLTTLLGLHIGPHAHAVGSIIGIFAAAWLIVVALESSPRPLAWTLLGADVIVTGGIGFLAVRGLKFNATHSIHKDRLESASGTAVTSLSPDGIVNVRGEQWSATSLNGSIEAGHPIQVVRVNGLRLEVWGEQHDSVLGLTANEGKTNPKRAVSQ